MINVRNNAKISNFFGIVGNPFFSRQLLRRSRQAATSGSGDGSPSRGCLHQQCC